MPTRDQIVTDLAVFSDLGTGPAVEEDVAGHLRVTWTNQGIARTAQFEAPNSASCSVSVDDGPTMDYPTFLASPFMADLSRLATKIRLLRGVLRARSSRELSSGETVYPLDWYVDPRLGASAGSSVAEGSALTKLQEFTDSSSTDATRLLFVMAEAGQGKSSVLEEFTVRQADRYLTRETSALALYIDAQGQGLGRLDQVIARQLIDLQFLLGYNALVALVREGLVVLVIDGFDELIGASGTFDDAFRSLSAFLELLEGSGSLIAAGRSTYFLQEYEARGRLLSDSLRYALEQAFLKEWTQADQDNFVQVALGTTRLPDKDRQRVVDAFAEFQADEQLRGLLGRPLFARDVLFLLLDGWRRPADLMAEKLIPHLAGEYLRREVSTKLRSGGESFLAVDQLVEYYRHLAEEMWELETRELDVADAETIMDTYADASWGLSGEAREIARARAGKLPFLAVGDSKSRVRFEHEVFFGFFLANSLLPALQESPMALALLGRGRLDRMTADLVVQMTALADQQEVLGSLGRLSKTRHPRRTQIAVNAGALGAAVLRRSSSSEQAHGLEIVDLAMTGEDLSGVVLTGCTFSGVHLDRVDLRGARLVDCSAVGLILDEPLVDADSTRLEVVGLNPDAHVRGLQFEHEGLLDLTFDPVKVREIGRQLGVPDARDGTPRFTPRKPVLDRIDQIVRNFRKANPLGTNHSRFGPLLTDQLGQDIVGILVRNGLLDIDAPRQTKGPSQTFYRKRFDEAALMAALSSPPANVGIDNAWEELSAL